MAGAGGASQRDHILEACRQTGKTPEELGYPEISLEDEEIPIPEDGLYLWFFFQELCGGRGNNGFGPRRCHGRTWKHGHGSRPPLSPHMKF